MVLRTRLLDGQLLHPDFSQSLSLRTPALSTVHPDVSGLAYYFIKKFNHAKSGVLNGTPDKTSGRAVTSSRFRSVAVAQNSCPEYSSEVLAYRG